MRLARRGEWIEASAVALARTGFCAYRAASQSLTHDEAFTYLNFLDAPWAKLGGLFDANNHVLYSAAAKVSIAAFGVSEWSIRLPSVVAGLVLTLGIFRLLERVESRAIRWLAYAALALDPLLLDFSIAARGYGMSLAFLVWAIDLAMRQRPAWSGVLLGLGTAANLTLAFPALALVVAQSAVQRSVRTVAAMLAPAVAVLAAICGPTLRYATRGHFYVGHATVWDSAFDLVHTTLRDSPRDGLLGSPDASTYITQWLVPLVALLWTGAAAWLFARGQRARLIVPLTLGVAMAGVVTAHVLFGVLYPLDRTGLYLTMLAGIAWAVLADAAPWRWFRVVNMALAAVLLVQFATQVQTRFFWPWWYNGATRDAAALLDRATRGEAPGSVSVSATLTQQPVLEFYRVHYEIGALRPIERQLPTALSGYDYYVLGPPDSAKAEENRLRVLYREPVSGVVVATSRRSK